MIYNNSYEGYKACELDRDCAKCKPKHSKTRKILLECGQGTGSRTFTSSNDDSFQLAHVTLYTIGLNRPEVLIKFSSIVKIEALSGGATVRLKYELFRVCGNENPESLGSWMFEEVGSAPIVFEIQKESFSFIFCECTNLIECCEYFVKVTPVEIIDAVATVSEGIISVLSQSMVNYSKSEDVILACGQGNGSIAFRQATISQPAVEIAHVSIDTSCLYKPEVLIEFSSVINTDFRVQDVRLEFELFRVCDDGEPLSRGIWTFERTNTNLPSAIDNAFTFIFCENISCSGCCEYFVTVKGIELNVTDPAIYLGVTVDNARIAAIAQSSKNNSYYNNYIPKTPKPKKIMLECGIGTGSKTFTSSSDLAFQLAHTTIDTTGLCNPIVNIEFSSIVSFEKLEEQGIAQLRYELFRVCDNRKAISLGIWIVGRIDFRIIDKSTNSFDFIFCDCVTCPGCCDYFVKVTPIEITEGFITATVSNGRMAALAQEIR